VPSLSRLLSAVVGAWLAAVPAAWATSTPAAGPVAAADEAVFAAALAALQSRHVEPQPPSQRMAAGLRGLRVAEPALNVSAAGGRLELSVGAAGRGVLLAPAGEDPAAWGRAGADALASAVAASPRLRALDPARRRGLVLEELASGLDPFTRYVPAAEAATLRAARLGTGGIGLDLSPEGASARITRLVPDGPAWRAGLALGDRVLAIDGAPTRGRTAEDLAEALAGEVGTAVALTVSRRGGGARGNVVPRVAVVPETARLSWEAGVPVIAITGFSRDTEQVVARFVAGLAARQPRPASLVVDLRGNRGGLLPQAVGVADVFLESGEVVHQRGRHPDASRTWLAGGADLAEGMRIVVLVDGGTASAAEAVAAALQDLRRALVVGSATRGKGLIQLVRPLPDGSELHLSWSRLLRSDDTPLQDRGVLPDLCTSRGESHARAEAERILAPKARGEAVGETGAKSAWREAAAPRGDRADCPPAEGSALDMEAALWLLHGSLAGPAEGGRGAAR
jgi:carboxyl-terminal processing protease